MSEEEIFQDLKEIIIEQLGVEEEKVTLEASFTDDLGADSLDVVELVMALEEKFNVEISDEKADKISTVEDLVKYIKELKQNNKKVIAKLAITFFINKEENAINIKK